MSLNNSDNQCSASTSIFTEIIWALNTEELYIDTFHSIVSEQKVTTTNSLINLISFTLHTCTQYQGFSACGKHPIGGKR
jgi:hypothetical protein